MCRRCGEPDKRGSSRDRSRRRQWLLDHFGDGREVECWQCGEVLTIFTVEADRIVPGGTYRRGNIWPACGPCNRAGLGTVIPEGCEYG